MALWVESIESTIFSVVQARAKPKLISKYPKIRFTTVSSVSTSAQFPSVYIHLLPMAEMDRDTDGNTVNSVLATFQIEVASNTKQADVKAVIYAILEEFKALRFSIPYMPEFTKDGDVFQATMRARRIIANLDKL